MASPIGQVAQESGFKGTSSHRIAEPREVRNLAVIDNTQPRRPAIRTSVDCYVSGQYVQQNGKIIEVTQRYSIFVGYSSQTQAQTMNELRSRIVMDFESKYGTTFNITTIHVPGLPVPAEREEVGEEQMYRGSSLFREMTKFEKRRYDIGSEHLKATTNIRAIRNRYKMR